MAWQRYLSVRSLAVAVLAIALTIMWASQIGGKRVEADAVQSTRMAVNLARHGVISLDEAPPYRATNFREPLPVFVSALGIRIIDTVLGDDTDDFAYMEGERAKYLKYQNFMWLGVLTVGAFWAVRTLTSSFWIGMLAAMIINHPLLPRRYSPVDDLLTELPGTAILVWASLALAAAFTSHRLRLFAFAGLLFGLFTLIKAVGLYVVLGLLLVLVCLYLLQRPRVSPRVAAREMGVLVLAFACVLAPWLYRNHVQLDSLQITQRGGQSFWERALTNDKITDREYLGTFYLWAPTQGVQSWLGRRLGFSQKDLLRGGQLERLETDFSTPLSRGDRPAVESGKPDEAITLFRQAQAERTRLEIEYAAAGHPHPDVAAEAAMYENAAALIAKKPWRHVETTVSFMWRGAAKTLPILVFALAFAMWRRRYDVVLFTMPAFGIVMVFSLFTPFFPRYGWMPRLICLLAIPVLLKMGWDLFKERRLAVQPSPP